MNIYKNRDPMPICWECHIIYCVYTGSTPSGNPYPGMICSVCNNNPVFCIRLSPHTPSWLNLIKLNYKN